MSKRRLGVGELERAIKDALQECHADLEFSEVASYAAKRHAEGMLAGIDEFDLRDALWRLIKRGEVVLTEERRIALAAPQAAA